MTHGRRLGFVLVAAALAALSGADAVAAQPQGELVYAMHVTITPGPDGTQLVDDTATDWGQPGKDDHRAIQKWTDLPLP